MLSDSQSGRLALPVQEVPSVLTGQVRSAPAHRPGLHTAHESMHSKTMAYQHLKQATLAKCLCFLCNNNSVLCKHLVWPFLLKCAKKLWLPWHGNDLEVWGYIQLCETWCCKCYYASIKFQPHMLADPSGAGFQNSFGCSLFLFGSCVFMKNLMQITSFSNIGPACKCKLHNKRWLIIRKNVFHYLSLSIIGATWRSDRLSHALDLT